MSEPNDQDKALAYKLFGVIVHNSQLEAVTAFREEIESRLAAKPEPRGDALLREIATFGDPDGQRGHALAKVREWGQKAAALLASSQGQGDVRIGYDWSATADGDDPDVCLYDKDGEWLANVKDHETARILLAGLKPHPQPDRLREVLELADKALESANYAEDHTVRTKLRAALAQSDKTYAGT